MSGLDDMMIVKDSLLSPSSSHSHSLPTPSRHRATKGSSVQSCRVRRDVSMARVSMGSVFAILATRVSIAQVRRLYSIKLDGQFGYEGG